MGQKMGQKNGTKNGTNIKYILIYNKVLAEKLPKKEETYPIFWPIKRRALLLFFFLVFSLFICYNHSVLYFYSKFPSCFLFCFFFLSHFFVPFFVPFF